MFLIIWMINRWTFSGSIMALLVFLSTSNQRPKPNVFKKQPRILVLRLHHCFRFKFWYLCLMHLKHESETSYGVLNFCNFKQHTVTLRPSAAVDARLTGHDGCCLIGWLSVLGIWLSIWACIQNGCQQVCTGSSPRLNEFSWVITWPELECWLASLEKSPIRSIWELRRLQNQLCQHVFYAIPINLILWHFMGLSLISSIILSQMIWT